MASAISVSRPRCELKKNFLKNKHTKRHAVLLKCDFFFCIFYNVCEGKIIQCSPELCFIYYMVNVTTNEESMHRMFEKVVLRHLHPLLKWLFSAFSSAISFKQMEDSSGTQKIFPILPQVFVGHLEKGQGNKNIFPSQKTLGQ